MVHQRIREQAEELRQLRAFASIYQERGVYYHRELLKAIKVIRVAKDLVQESEEYFSGMFPRLKLAIKEWEDVAGHTE